MKFVIFLISFLSFICSCNNNGKHAGKDLSREKFDKIKWQTKIDKEYPYRDKMLNDLITNYKLSGLKKDEVLDLLGHQPGLIITIFSIL